MRWVSYTRSISSRIGEENPANTIAEQNANIEQYLKNKGYRISEKYSDRKRSAEAADGFDRMVQDGMTQNSMRLPLIPSSVLARHCHLPLRYYRKLFIRLVFSLLLLRMILQYRPNSGRSGTVF